MTGGDDYDPSKAAVKASSAAILARILVMNTSYFAHLTAEPSLSLLLQTSGVPIAENILLSLVDIWLDKVSDACIPLMWLLLVTLLNIFLLFFYPLLEIEEWNTFLTL